MLKLYDIVSHVCAPDLKMIVVKIPKEGECICRWQVNGIFYDQIFNKSELSPVTSQSRN